MLRQSAERPIPEYDLISDDDDYVPVPSDLWQQCLLFEKEVFYVDNDFVLRGSVVGAAQNERLTAAGFYDDTTLIYTVAYNLGKGYLAYEHLNFVDLRTRVCGLRAAKA